MILYYFSGSWCAPCKAFRPVAERVAAALAIPFKPIDVQEEQTLAAELLVQTVPAIRLVADGRVLCAIDGVRTGAALQVDLAKHA